MSFIRTRLCALAVGSILSAAAFAQAQETAPPEPSTSSQSAPLQRNSPAASGAQEAPSAGTSSTAAAPLDDQKIKQFASAYLEVATIQRDANAQLETASDPAKAEQVKTNAESAMIAAVQRNGLDVQQFNQIVQTMAADESVRSRVTAELQQRTGGNAP